MRHIRVSKLALTRSALLFAAFWFSAFGWVGPERRQHQPRSPLGCSGRKRRGSFEPDDMVRLICTSDKHHKFWEIEVSGKETTVRYGRIDTKGRTSKKSHEDADAAKAFMEKQIKAKRKKVGGGPQQIGWQAPKGYIEPEQNEAETEETDKAPVPAVDKAVANPPNLVLKWGDFAGHGACKENAFMKASGRESVGARSSQPLPKDVTWTVRYSLIGSHQAVGVATKDAPLCMDGYHFVFGDETEKGESWALCFTKSLDEFLARHEAHELEELHSETPLKEGQAVEFQLRLSKGKELYVRLPNSKKEELLFSDLPEEELYAVASATYYHTQVVIQNPSDPQPAPDLDPDAKQVKKIPTRPHPAAVRTPPPKRKKRAFPPLPAFNKKGLVESAVAKVEGGAAWELEELERKVLKNENCLDDRMRQQMAFLMQYGIMFRECDSLEACFNERVVDDGIMVVRTLKSAALPNVLLSYFEGGFGGNSMGFMMVEEDGVTKCILENCDTDLSWRGPNEKSKAAEAFVQAFWTIRYDD
ncbi:unnamed protein product [Effrenium voratum]|uniref:WGR domain-containing protein n=1 Tax=Effrenium voratum TaxID=2562239 RepID=A0AA36ILG1_9DINO|nr:unnamed protein product [Effrenium voratum]